MTSPLGLPFDDADEPRRPAVTRAPERRVPVPPVPAEPDISASSATSADAPPARRVLTVGELTGALREILEESFADVWVEGELSNARVWNTGHLYFTLKDRAAQIRGVMFRSALRYLKFKPADGLRVVLRGRLSVYDPKGEYQIVAEHMEPQGFGPLQLAFEQLKRTLQAEGLFDKARKRALPALPRRIGIVTSIDGAALRDIVRVLRRRYPNAHLVIAPSRVQGDGAAAEIARALTRLCRIDGVDVIIAGRGGGSLEDLWAFNEEIVARALAACPVPIISAVGHETDFTIADFVADLRAPTPSAAAELVVRQKDDFVASIDRLGERARAAVAGRCRMVEARLHQLGASRGLAGVPARVALDGRRLSETDGRLRQAIRTTLGGARKALDGLQRSHGRFDPLHRLAANRTALTARQARLDAAMTRRRHDAAARLGSLAGRLDTLSPLAVLGRGYAVCWDAGHARIIRDARAVAAGDTIHVTLDRGELACEVKNRQGA